MNDGIEFSKPLYKWISYLIYLCGAIPFLYVLYGVESDFIDEKDKYLYISIIFSVIFLIDLVFGLIIGEMAVGVAVIKRKINPVMFIFRATLSIVIVVLGGIIALNHI